MSVIRILAIEDDPIYAESIKLVVQELGYVLIDVVQSISEFKRLVKATIPDILLVDIDLGAEIDGIELANQISEESNAPVIFLTAYKDTETIIRAKDARPSAYLTKPYEAVLLQAAIEIAVSGGKTAQNPSEGFTMSMQKESLFVKSGGSLKKVSIAEILFIEVKEKFCQLHGLSTYLEINIRLKDLIEKLPANQFIQTHRSFVVNKNHIDEVDAGFSKLQIKATTIPIGKNYKETVSAALDRVG